MKTLVSVVLIMAIALFAGCTSKSVDSENTGGVKDSAVSSDKTGGSANPAPQNQGDSNTIKPGTVPQLSNKQKSDVNTKVNSVLNNIDNTLNSLQDPQDIDLNSVN